MWTRIKRWWAAEGALVGLQGMSDRMLEDMGLDREGLAERVRGGEDPKPDTRPDRQGVSAGQVQGC
jgi:hypothetical protein